MTNRVSQPWELEPDHVSLMNSDGYHMLINRNWSKALCGYVGVPETHPYYGITDIFDKRLSSLQVHGGVTYSRPGSEHNLESDNEDLWYIGFDCAHFMDYVPGLVEVLNQIRGEDGIQEMFDSAFFDNISQYRDMEYVTNEVQGLYEQLQAAMKPA